MAVTHNRGMPRTQTALLPETVEDYVPPQHMVRVIDLYVDGLNLAALGFKRSLTRDTGRPPYSPVELLKLYLYGYWQQIRSSRKLEAECRRNLEVMFLVNRLTPDFKTIANFRSDNAAAIQAACAGLVQFLREAQLVGGEAPVVAIDGSKFKACASSSSLLTAEQVARRLEQTKARVGAYLEQLERADREEAQSPEPDKAAIEAALEKLRARQQQLEQARQTLHGAESQAEATPRVGLTDPDCVMLHGGLPGYNVQQAVDTQHKLIVAHEVTTRRNDQTSLLPMAQAAQQQLQAPMMTALADTGYMNGEQAEACEALGIIPVVPMQQPAYTRGGELYPKSQFTFDPATDTYRCPAGELLSRFKRSRTRRTDYYRTPACKGCALKPRCTTGRYRSIARPWYAQAAERADQRVLNNPTLMRSRAAAVEHPFGHLKFMMPGGFLLRTLAKVKGEMALSVLTYNLKRVLRILGIERLRQMLSAKVLHTPG